MNLTLTRAAVAVATCLALAGCDMAAAADNSNVVPPKPRIQAPSGPALDGGTVTHISRRPDGRYRLCSALDAPGQDGRQGCSAVKARAAKNCFVGAQWPTCADRSDRARPSTATEAHQ